MAQYRHGFIFPDIGDPYVYLKTLENSNHRGQKVGREASNILSQMKASFE